jgi:hypothetical protein
MSRFALALVFASALALFGPGPAWAGGYGPFDWGEGLKSATKKLDGRKLTPRTDLETVIAEARLLRDERDEKVRLARLKKKPAAEIRRLQKAPPAKARLSAWYYWVELGNLDAKVVLHFLDERLTSAEVNVLFEAAQREAAAELLDLMQSKYGAPKEHRGAESPAAPVVDTFDAGDTEIEAYQQPAVNGRKGFLRLIYRSKDRRETITTYLGQLEERRKALDLARNPPGPTPEEREMHRKSALMQHL